jgi:hypothetical protein
MLRPQGLRKGSFSRRTTLRATFTEFECKIRLIAPGDDSDVVFQLCNANYVQKRKRK